MHRTSARPHVRPPRRRARVALAVVVSVLVGIHLLAPPLASDVVYPLSSTLAAAIAVVGLRRRRPRGVGHLGWIAAGVLLFAAGDLLHAAIVTLSEHPPEHTAAEVPWALATAAIGVGMLRLLLSARRTTRFDVDAAVDTAAAAILVVLLAWPVALHPVLTDATVSPGARANVAIFFCLDAVLLAALIRALMSRRTRAAGGPLLLTGVAVILLGDYLAVYGTVAGPVGRLPSAAWMVLGVLLACAVWPSERRQRAIARVHSREVAAARDRAALTDPLEVVRIALAIAPVMTPLLVDVWSGLDDGLHTGVMVGSTVALGGLAFTRSLRLHRAARRAHELLASRERRFRTLALNATSALLVVDRTGRITDDSENVRELLAAHGTSVVGTDALDLIHPSDREGVEAGFERAVALPGQVVEVEFRLARAEGGERWVAARVISHLDHPDVRGVVVSAHDITGRKRAEAELAHQAFHDPLTGLANRALFRNRLEHAVERVHRAGPTPVVLYLDLDGFKTVNDSLGHEVGDGLLRAVAGRLSSIVRTGDTVARLGGDEFGILLEQHDPDDAALADLAARLLADVTRPTEVAGHTLAPTVSIGVAVGQPDDDAASLLRNADIAMYRAKAGGKARWVRYEPHMRAAADERLRLDVDLIGALERNELALVYQPVVDLDTEEVTGFEALLRWHHPTLGLVPPDRFIPVAEDNGMIVPIGRWVLEEACRTAAGWQRDLPPGRTVGISVNVSARQLAHDELIDHVRDALSDSGLDPAALVLEMTETAVVGDLGATGRRLHQLRRLGVRLAIDDFGTGYSSLSHLRQFPMDIIKIDRSFVAAITDDDDFPPIVRGLLDLGRALGLQTIAEGVELDVQRGLLRDQDCRLAQGYLFARPMPADEAAALVAGGLAAQAT